LIPRHSHNGEEVVYSLSADAAYQAAGYKRDRGNATRLTANDSIQKRVAEIQGKAAEKAEVTKAWVMARLKEIVERAMQAVQVLDHDGNPTGEYSYQGNVANKALELLGKEIGMFVGRREDDLAMTLRVMIDAPPDETREQWLERTARERGLPPAIVGPAARPTNGRDNS
jgi:Terminase small subunit